ncbi:integrase [Pseudoalteromonas sp. SMN1298-MNA-CIBAN-0114]|uniref:integrase n=2 Tax=unclassified Pseudoalteromonas TaxID=194690 RepID=UPI00333476B7
MANSKVRSYLNKLKKEDKFHPCYQQIEHAYKNLLDDDFGIRLSDVAFLKEYKKLCILMLRCFQKSDESVLAIEMDVLKSRLKEDLATKQLQLMIIDAILKYGLKHHGIESSRVSQVVVLKRDKPMLSPVELIKLPVALQVKSLLNNELQTPTANLSMEGRFGRLALFLYMTTGVQFDELITIINTPYNLMYLDGLVFWYGKIEKEERRYVLCDAVVLLLLQHQASVKQCEKVLLNKNRLKDYITKFLTETSGKNWQSLSLLKLRTLRKIDAIINLSPIDYQMYLRPSTCTGLPQTAFVRLISNKALIADEVAKINNKFNKFNKLLPFDSDSFDYIEPKLVILKLEHIYKNLKELNSQRAPRVQCIRFVEQELKNEKNSIYFYILCGWLYYLLKEGGVAKRRLKIGTVIDYVKSISKPFLTVFTQTDLAIISASDWAIKLNDATEYFTSAPRKKYLYYFSEFLIESEIVKDLCIDDLDIAPVQSKVDANLVTASHASAILEYLSNNLNNSLVELYAYLLMCFCFYSGLRRNEAAKLYFGDIQVSPVKPNEGEYDWILLSIRPNKIRGLKTPSARRELPLDALWPKEHLAKLRSFYDVQKNTENKPSNSLLFNCSVSVNKAYELLTQLLHYYTKDHTLRIHHLRHSFANWTWYRLNSNLVLTGRQYLSIFENDLFDQNFITHFNKRLKVKDNTRSKMFFLSHLLGHKVTVSTLNSYLHLKDIQHCAQMNQTYTVSKYFLSECIGRANFKEFMPGESLIERIEFYSKKQEQDYSIQYAGKVSDLITPSFKGFKQKFKADGQIRMLDYANALKSLELNSVHDTASSYSLPVEQVQKLHDNALSVSREYPRKGKKLPLIPNFPSLDNTKDDLKRVSSQKAFYYLCQKFDTLLSQKNVTLSEAFDALQILKYAAAGKNFALRCPDGQVIRNFLNLCIKFKLKSGHFKFRFHQVDLQNQNVTQARSYWEQLVSSFGLSDSHIESASIEEGRFLGKHNGNGFLEVGLLITVKGSKGTYKNSRRHHSLMSFLHLLLIISYRAGEDP